MANPRKIAKVMLENKALYGIIVMEPTEPSHVSPQVSEVLDKARYRRFNVSIVRSKAVKTGIKEDVLEISN